jgi:8-oxo-dGTP pyrophosphatase MutT (NUDIX family)
MKQTVRKITTSRGIIWHEGRLLLVSHNKNTWYAPGGWLDDFETLDATCKRELHEELGVEVVVGELVKVAQYIETAAVNSYGEDINKIEHYFACTLKTMPQIEGENNLWVDSDNGLVKFAKWFSKEELTSGQYKIGPKWLIQSEIPDGKIFVGVSE